MGSKYLVVHRSLYPFHFLLSPNLFPSDKLRKRRQKMPTMRLPESLISKLNHTKAVEDDISAIKIENCVGFSRVPLGIAGPLRVDGSDGTSGSFYGPLATCEATLVASCSRGCKALNLCGGVQIQSPPRVHVPCSCILVSRHR